MYIYIYDVVMVMVMVCLSSIQEGLASLHIACNKGMLKAVRLIRKEGEGQERFIRRKKEAKFGSDFEVLINAKAAKFVSVCVDDYKGGLHMYYDYRVGLHAPP